MDKIIDKLYPPEEYVLGLCHQIWNTEKILYALLWYKWYSAQDIEPDTFFD